MSQALTPQQRQAALDNISPEDQEKIAGKQSQDGIVVSPEWMLLAEFGMLYGWDAYMAASRDKITGAEMMTLITAGRKIKASQNYDDAVAAFIGAISGSSKKPGDTFKKLTKDILKAAKVDD